MSTSNSYLYIGIKLKKQRTLDLKIEIKPWSLGIRALGVRALIPLTLYYIPVTSTRWNYEEEDEDLLKKAQSTRIKYAIFFLLKFLTFIRSSLLLLLNSSKNSIYFSVIQYIIGYIYIKLILFSDGVLLDRIVMQYSKVFLLVKRSND